MENTSSFLFQCRTHDGYIFKILIELLHNILKTACFEITPHALKLRMMDSNRRTLVDLSMEASNFNLYHFSPSIENEIIHVGLNLNHFYKMLRSIKKRDQLILFIDETRSRDLGIHIIPKDFSRLTTSYIKIQNIQNLDIALPEQTDHSILVSSSEFSKMCKDLFNISNTISIIAEKYYIKFVCNVTNIYSREVILGETKSLLDKYEKPSVENEYSFSEEYDTEQLSRILKITGLHSNIIIYCYPNLPIMLLSRIGTLGSIRIYIKSKKQLEEILST